MRRNKVMYTCLLLPVLLGIRVRQPRQLRLWVSLLLLLLLVLLLLANEVWRQLVLLHKILQLPPPAAAAARQTCSAKAGDGSNSGPLAAAWQRGAGVLQGLYCALRQPVCAATTNA